jgi:chromosome segregation ATPase
VSDGNSYTLWYRNRIRELEAELKEYQDEFWPRGPKGAQLAEWKARAEKAEHKCDELELSQGNLRELLRSAEARVAKLEAKYRQLKDHHDDVCPAGEAHELKGED